MLLFGLRTATVAAGSSLLAKLAPTSGIWYSSQLTSSPKKLDRALSGKKEKERERELFQNLVQNYSKSTPTTRGGASLLTKILL